MLIYVLCTMKKYIGERDWGVVGRLRTDDEEVIHISGFDEEVVWERVCLLEAILERTDFEIVWERGIVPVEVACLGKAGLAAYLVAVHGQSRKDVADILSVAPSTIKQYLSDFRNERR